MITLFFEVIVKEVMYESGCMLACMHVMSCAGSSPSTVSVRVSVESIKCV